MATTNILTVPQLLAARRADASGVECLVVDDDRFSYADIDERSAYLARHLVDAGVGFGTRIGLLLGNTAEFAVTWLAITRIGAVAVPISTLSTPTEIRRIVAHANLHGIVSAPAYRHHSLTDRLREALDLGDGDRVPLRSATVPTLRQVWLWGDGVPGWAAPVVPGDVTTTRSLLGHVEESISAADIATIIYTSGSTAEPKGVLHTHGSLLRVARKSRDSYDRHIGDRAFTQMPFFWVGGLTINLLGVMFSRGTLVTCTSSAPTDVVAFLERERVTHVSSWPHLARAIAADPSFPRRDLSSVRVGSLWEAFPEARRPRDPSLWTSALSMTETAGPHTIPSMTELPEHRRGSFGPPQPGIEHRVVDPATGEVLPDGEKGELHVRGDTLMYGLVRKERQETFDPDGWYATGDLVSIRDGEVYFQGRIDDMIKTAGANVSSREVEDCILGLPGVVAATVTSVVDPNRGSVVGAAVVTADRNLTADRIRSAARGELAVYKVPRVVVVLHPDDVPIKSSGKVDRQVIVQMLAEQYASLRTKSVSHLDHGV